MPVRCQWPAARVPPPAAMLCPAQPAQRTYATSAPPPVVKNPLQRRRGGDLGAHLPKNIIPNDAYIPAYPYGEHQLFKQANKGLYGEQMIRFGNNVSTDTETKTRRNWKPNVLSKSLYSVALKKRIKLRITAKVLKTMDREGGLDEYLLKDNVARIKELGPMGWALRWTLMQKPDVVERLRADAAALGLDQATIDKQWPTPAMMAERNVTESTPANHVFAESEGQEMWAPEDVDTPESLSDLTNPSKDEEKAAAAAAKEYIKAVKAAKHHLDRGVVDSEEEGLKLAFIRAKEREELSAALRSNYKKQYQEADISAQELQEIRARYNITSTRDPTARKIAYNQRRRKEIAEAGGIEAWKAATQAAEKAAFATRVQEAGGEDAFRAARKAEYAKLIAEAETASTNSALDTHKRTYLDNAIQKADKAIKAKATGGQDVYVESVMQDLRNQRLDGGGAAAGLRAIYQASTKEKNATGDAWAALVNSSTKTAGGSRPRA